MYHAFMLIGKDEHVMELGKMTGFPEFDFNPNKLSHR